MLQKSVTLFCVALSCSACTETRIRPVGGPSEEAKRTPNAASAPDHVDAKSHRRPSSPDEENSEESTQSKVVGTLGLADGTDTSVPSTTARRGRPWAHNTGPRDPDAITRYTGPSTITTDDAVYENFSITGGLRIDADNVTIRNFVIKGSGALYALQVLPGATRFTAEDGEITKAASALVYDQGTNSTFRRLYLHDCNKDAMTMHGSGVLVEGCFVEKIGMGVDTHPDVIANGAASSSNQTFRGNNFYVPAPSTPNWPGTPYSANSVAIFNDLGTYTNIVFENNWINGGGYSIYCSDGMTIRNNLFGRDYHFGIYTSHKGGSCVWTNNRWEDTGDPI